MVNKLRYGDTIIPYSVIQTKRKKTKRRVKRNKRKDFSYWIDVKKSRNDWFSLWMGYWSRNHY